MAGIPRLDSLIRTDKQRNFSFDFLSGWENYESWEDVCVGATAVAPVAYVITAEDIIEYNRACGETDPLFVDVDFALKNSPTGELLQHPLFASALPFYCLGNSGIGTWLRMPGARNPYQRIELFEAFKIGEVIDAHVTATDKFIQRNKHYVSMRLEFRNRSGILKAIWHCSLIIPPNREAVGKLVKFSA